jgi:hypothetical protein
MDKGVLEPQNMMLIVGIITLVELQREGIGASE